MLGAFGLSIGTAIGWGSFVVTSSSYLSKAGPLGSTIGTIIGMLVMMVVAYNYHYMINKYPEDNGGLYTYVKKTFGADHAFLSAWFLIITYFAILWANASSFALFARYLFGSTFQFGFLYAIGGYEIWIGEILLSVFFLCLFGGLCLLNKRITTTIQGSLACFFVAAIIAVFLAVTIMNRGGIKTYEPGFAGSGENEFGQIMDVVYMAPWAFIGFESISNSSKDFRFSHKKVLRILLLSVVVTALLYILLCFVSISARPEGYANWYEYLSSHSELKGLDAIPPFYAAHYYLGNAGLIIFGIVLFAIVVTSLIGNIFGLSNLLKHMAEEDVLPPILKKETRWGNPKGAIIFILIVSVLITFVGRAAIGWIVDVNSLCGIIIYFYVSACVLRIGLREKDNKGKVFGIIGVIIGFAFIVLFLVPNFIGTGDMAKESFFFFVVWSVAGFVYFFFVLKKDKKGEFGHSMVVWFGLFLLIVFATSMWLTKAIRESDADLVSKLLEHFGGGGASQDEFVAALNKENDRKILLGVIVVVGILLITQFVMFNVFSLMKKRELESQRMKAIAEEMATKDAMTGVRNKHAYAYKEKEITDKIDAGEAISFGIVVCDVNNLKYINDNFGHEYGDKLIKEACCIICSTYEHSPVFRVGGDEFVVVLEGQDYENRDALLAKMNEIAEANNQVDGGIVISVGMGIYDPKDAHNFAAAFRIADQAMYIRKQELKAVNNKNGR